MENQLVTASITCHEYLKDLEMEWKEGGAGNLYDIDKYSGFWWKYSEPQMSVGFT